MSIRTEIPKDLELDNPLWQFAGSVWRQPAVESACLALQGKGWSVTDVLCALWCSTQGVRFTGLSDPQVMTWRTTVTEPLRRVRQSLRKGNPITDPVRSHIAQNELNAEQIELALAYRSLADRAERPDSTEHTAQTLALDNLQAAAPEKHMDNDTGTLLETLASQLALPLARETLSC